MDAAEKQEILDAIGRVESRLVEKAHADEARFEELEQDTRENRDAIRDVANAQALASKQQLEMAEAMTRIVNSSAVASELALKALRAAEDSDDRTKKMIAGAMTIQKDAITAAVKEVVQPVVDDVTALKENDTTQNETLTAQNETLDDIKSTVGTIAKALVHPKLRKALVVTVIIGTLIGSGIAGYEMAHSGSAAKKTLAP